MTKSIFELTGQACHRELEKIASIQFAVSGPRNVAAFLFENKKRVRIYDMEADELSDEEDEDFVKEFESLMKTEENAAAYNTGKNADLTVPLSAKKQIENESEKQEGKRVFALVTRKGTKTNVQALQIDEDSRLAQGLEAAEKERLATTTIQSRFKTR